MSSGEFFTLIPKSNKPHFKKKWQKWLWKKLSKWRSGRYVEDFHFVRLDNLVIYRTDKPKVIVSKSKFDIKKIRSLKKKHSDLYVLINATDLMYMRVSLKSYIKLMEIDKIAIEFKLRAAFDGEFDVMDVYDNTIILDNINDLARFINQHRCSINGIYELQVNCCGYTDYDYRFHIMVYKRDGSIETYKSDMNDFMEAYGLYQF